MTAADKARMEAAWDETFKLALHGSDDVNFAMSRVSSIIWVKLQNRKNIPQARIERMKRIAA